MLIPQSSKTGDEQPLKQKDMKKLLILNAPYLIFIRLGTRLGQAARLAPGSDFSGKGLHIMEGLGSAVPAAARPASGSNRVRP